MVVTALHPSVEKSTSRAEGQTVEMAGMAVLSTSG